MGLRELILDNNNISDQEMRLPLLPFLTTLSLNKNRFVFTLLLLITAAVHLNHKCLTCGPWSDYGKLTEYFWSSLDFGHETVKLGGGGRTASWTFLI